MLFNEAPRRRKIVHAALMCISLVQMVALIVILAEQGSLLSAYAALLSVVPDDVASTSVKAAFSMKLEGSLAKHLLIAAPIALVVVVLLDRDWAIKAWLLRDKRSENANS